MPRYAKAYADAYVRYLYALVGGGEFLVERSRELAGKASSLADARRKDAVKLYDDLAVRGQRLVGKLGKSQPAKRVSGNAKQAQRQIKGAVTSVRKALRMEEQKAAGKAG